jgi:hypothetical protein
MREQLRKQDKTLLLTHLPEHCSDLFGDKAGSIGHGENLFVDIDSALEWCEDRLLHEEQPELLRECRQVILSEMDILGGFDPGQIALIESVLKEVRYSPGETSSGRVKSPTLSISWPLTE